MQVQVLLLALLPCVSAWVPGVRVPASTREVHRDALPKLSLPNLGDFLPGPEDFKSKKGLQWSKETDDVEDPWFPSTVFSSPKTPVESQALWEAEIAELKQMQMKDNGKEFNHAEDDFQKHTPYLQIHGTSATVTVGKGVESNPYHPLSGEHYITHIYVLDQDGKPVAMSHQNPVEPGQQAEVADMTFEIPAGTTKLHPFEHCNTHGLWDGPEVVVPTQTTWEIEIAQLKHTEMMEHGDEVQHGSDTEKHTPFLTVEGSKAKVTVGKGTEENPFHPVTGEHYITHVYVVDQNGKPVAMQYPKGGKKAEMSFDIPEGTTKLRAFEHCNMDGLWEGPEVKVAAKEAVPARLLSRIAEPGLVLV